VLHGTLVLQIGNLTYSVCVGGVLSGYWERWLIEGNDCGSLVTINNERTNWSDSGLVISLCLMCILGNELIIVKLCYHFFV